MLATTLAVTLTLTLTNPSRNPNRSHHPNRNRNRNPNRTHHPNRNCNPNPYPNSLNLNLNSGALVCLAPYSCNLNLAIILT